MGDTIQPTTVAQLSSFQRDILRAVAKADAHPQGEFPHGVGVLGQLQADGYVNVNHSRLYPNLAELVDLGLLRKHSINDRTDGYEIAGRGKDTLDDLKARYIDAANEAFAEGPDE